MTTRETIERYFAALEAKEGWENHLANEMTFTSHAAPSKRVTGRDAYVESTRGFFGMINTVQVQELMVDGNRACALTRYHLQPPAGEPFTSDVAEVFVVEDDRIDSLSIYFDTAPFPG